MNKKEIVQHYQQTFFVFDLLASMPFVRSLCENIGDCSLD